MVEVGFKGDEQQELSGYMPTRLISDCKLLLGASVRIMVVCSLPHPITARIGSSPLGFKLDEK